MILQCINRFNKLNINVNPAYGEVQGNFQKLAHFLNGCNSKI